VSVVYIISDHGKLNQSNEIFEFTSADGTIRKIFPHNMKVFVPSNIFRCSDII